MTETRPAHGKLDHHVSAGRKREGYQQLPVSVEFTKYGNTLFRPVLLPRRPGRFRTRVRLGTCSFASFVCTSGASGISIKFSS